MSEHRIPLYLRVAGELVIIVTGVLVALWVDNLNQDRREVSQVEAYLEGILDDLRRDSVDLAERRATAERSVAVANRLMELRRGTLATVPPDSLAAWVFFTSFTDNFQAVDHTYQQLLSVGGLSLIPDADLRRRIQEYYRGIASADFFTDYYKKEDQDFWDLLEARLHPDDFEGVSIRGRLTPESRFDASRVLRLIRTDAEFINAVQMSRHWADQRLRVSDNRVRRNAATAEAIRAALGS